jgi:disulfide bond formation protein DsbB
MTKQNLSVEEMLKQIESAPIVACDQPQWEFMGVTMAMLNSLYSFTLSVIMFIMFRKINLQGKSANRLA